MRVLGIILTVSRYLLIIGAGGFIVYQIMLPKWPDGIQIATGTEAGVYNELGENLRRQLISYPDLVGVHITTKRTSGAIENEQLLVSNQVDVAFLQGDKEFPKDASLIARLYGEKLHIIVKRKDVNSIQDLRGQVIGVWSEPDSGTDRLLKKVLNSVGLEFQKVSDISNLAVANDRVGLFYEKERNADGKVQLHETTHDFDADRVAALVAVAGDNSPFVNARFTDDSLNRENRILEIALPTDNKLFQDRRLYLTTIPRGAYRKGVVTYPEKPVTTIGTDALLATRSSLDDRVAYQLARATFDPDFANSRPDLFKVTEQDANNVHRVHPGAQAFLRGNTMPRAPMTFELKHFLALGSLLVLLFAPKFLLVLMTLDIPFIKEAGPIFYGSIVGRFMIANALLKAAGRDKGLQLARKEYLGLPMRLSGHEYKNSEELMAAFKMTSETLVVVEGEGGTGKTTFMTHVFDFMVADLNPRTPLPILLTNPGFSSSLSTSLIASMKRYGVYINDEILHSLLLQSKITLLIDGIDGLPEPVREKTINDVMELISSYPMMRVILSARDPVLPRPPMIIETKLLDRTLAQSLFDRLRSATQRETIAIPDEVLDILDRPLMVRLLDRAANSGTMPDSKQDLLRRYTREVLRDSAFGGMEYETCEKVLRKLSIALLFEKNSSRFTMEMAEEVLVPVIQRLESQRGKLTTAHAFMRSAIAAGIIRRDDHVLRFFHDFILNYFAALELREMQVGDNAKYRELRASHRGAEAFGMIPSLSIQHVASPGV